jgi:putative transposase
MTLYQKTRTTCEERNLAYRELFRNQVVGKLLIDIRQAANKGLVLGTKRYVKEVETLTG